MPKVTEAHLESRRRQILDAAFDCFARQGFHQTTMQDICRVAELSPGAVYRYFDGKEAIIEATFLQCQEMNAAVQEDVAELTGTLETLDHLADEAFAEVGQAKAQAGLQVQGWSEALRSPRVKEMLNRYEVDFWKGALGQIIGRAQAAGEVDAALDTESVARVLLATWQGYVLQKALDPEVDVTSYLEVVKAMYGGSFWQAPKSEDSGQ